MSSKPSFKPTPNEGGDNSGLKKSRLLLSGVLVGALASGGAYAALGSSQDSTHSNNEPDTSMEANRYSKAFQETAMKMIESKKLNMELSEVAKSCISRVLADDEGPLTDEELKYGIATLEEELNILATFEDIKDGAKKSTLLDLVQRGIYPSEALETLNFIKEKN